jgi:hypothetical protein
VSPNRSHGLVEQAPLDALHREGDGPAGRDRVEPEGVAASAGREHGVRVGHAAQRAEREDALVLDPHLATAGGRVVVGAADGAGRARGARHAPLGTEVLRGELGRLRVARGLEVARRERRERVEREQVGQRPELAVLGGGRTERAGAKVGRGPEDAVRVGGTHLRDGPDGHGLQELRAEHGPEAAAARMAAVGGDGREADEPLACRPDRGDPPGAAEPAPQSVLGLGRPEAPRLAGGLEPHPVAVDDEDGRPLAAPVDHDRVVPARLARDREVARGQGVRREPRERRERHDGQLRARGQRRPDERREHERERRVGIERVDARRGEPVEQPGPEACPADEGAQHVSGSGRVSAVPVPTSTTSAARSSRPASSARLGAQEADRLPACERHVRVAADPVAVDRGHDVPVQVEADGRRGPGHRGGAHAHRRTDPGRPERAEARHRDGGSGASWARS